MFKKLFRNTLFVVLAAAITLAVLFLGSVIYKLTVYEPDPPPQAKCESLTVKVTPNGYAELRLYQCQRGDQASPWQGYELWLFEPLVDDWQRLLTAAPNSCLQLGDLSDRQLQVLHQGSRGDINRSATTYHYENDDGISQSFLLQLEAQPETTSNDSSKESCQH